MHNKAEIKTLAIIPARSNSKRVPGKNLKKLGQTPLFVYTLLAALQCDEIDLVCLTTESNDIEEVAMKYARQIGKLDKLDIIHRAMYLTMDHVQLDEVATAALRQYELNGYNIETVVVLQATSPFRNTNHIIQALQLFKNLNKTINTIFTVEMDNGFHWNWDHETGEFSPLGHSPEKRLGGQWEWQNHSIMKENGAMYVTRADVMTHTKAFRNAPYYPFVMDSKYSVDIDYPEDWNKAEQQLEAIIGEMGE